MGGAATGARAATMGGTKSWTPSGATTGATPSAARMGGAATGAICKAVPSVAYTPGCSLIFYGHDAYMRGVVSSDSATTILLTLA